LQPAPAKEKLPLLISRRTFSVLEEVAWLGAKYQRIPSLYFSLDLAIPEETWRKVCRTSLYSPSF
jgi:hypothetical protein